MSDERPRYAATFPAEPATVSRVRREMAAVATECGLSEEVIVDIRIAVSEIVTNAIVHAYDYGPGEVRVEAYFARGDLRVVVADDGPGMAPRVKSPGLGLGLPTAATVTTELTIVTPRRGGTEVHLTFRGD
ncbi:MAG: serine/threonine-protein kinase RsbW [Actinomycetota bacterium]